MGTLIDFGLTSAIWTLADHTPGIQEFVGHPATAVKSQLSGLALTTLIHGFGVEVLCG